MRKGGKKRFVFVVCCLLLCDVNILIVVFYLLVLISSSDFYYIYFLSGEETKNLSVAFCSFSVLFLFFCLSFVPEKNSKVNQFSLYHSKVH